MTKLFTRSLLLMLMCARAFAGTGFQYTNTINLSSDTMGVSVPFSAVASDDSRYVYVADNINHSLAVFGVNLNTGNLNFSNCYKDISVDVQTKGSCSLVPGLLNPWKITASPQTGSPYIFIISRSNNSSSQADTLAVYQRNSNTGQLTLADMFTNNKTTPAMKLPSDLVVSPDGKYVYVSGAGDDSIAVFEFNQNTSALSLLQVLQNNQTNNQNTISGLLTPNSLVMSPEGKNLYVTSFEDNAIVAFATDPDTGLLSYVSTVHQGDTVGAGGTVQGMTGPWNAVVSNDGNNVYASSWVDGAIAVFSRNTDTGDITYQSHYDNASCIVDQNNQASNCLTDVAYLNTTQDNTNVFATSFTPDGTGNGVLNALFRNPDNGELTIFQVQSDDGVQPYALTEVKSTLPLPNNEYFYTFTPTGEIGIYRTVIADLKIAGTVDTSAVDSNGNFSITLQLKNTGPAVADNVVFEAALSDTSVASFTQINTAGTTPGLDCSGTPITSQRLKCTIPQMTVGTANISVNLLLNSTSATNLALTANAYATEMDGTDNRTTIETQDLNLPPVANNDYCIVPPGSSVQIPVLENDTDPNSGDSLYIEDLTGNVTGVARLAAGSDFINYTAPAVSDGLVDELSYTASDGKAKSLMTNVKVLVAKSPVAINDMINAAPGEQWNIYVLANDDKQPNQVITLINPPTMSTNGVNVYFNADNTVSYTAPSRLNNSVDTFTYTITDENIKNFADQYNIDLTTAHGPCFSVTSKANVTINISESNTTDPSKPGNDNQQSSESGSGGGGSFGWWLPLVSLVVFFNNRTAATRKRKLNNKPIERI